MKLIEGGIRMPSVPPAAIVPRNRLSSYLRFWISGSATMPIGGRRRDAGAGGRREHGAGADVGVHQAARQPGQPLGDGIIDALGNAGAQQDLAQHDEQRDGDQDVFALEAFQMISPIARYSGIEERTG